MNNMTPCPKATEKIPQNAECNLHKITMVSHFFVQLPNKLRASSVIPTLRLLKSEPASNYAKFLESFKTGKRNQEPSKPNKEHQTTTTPGSHEKNTMVSQVICSAQKWKWCEHFASHKKSDKSLVSKKCPSSVTSKVLDYHQFILETTLKHGANTTDVGPDNPTHSDALLLERHKNHSTSKRQVSSKSFKLHRDHCFSGMPSHGGQAAATSFKLWRPHRRIWTTSTLCGI